MDSIWLQLVIDDVEGALKKSVDNGAVAQFYVDMHSEIKDIEGRASQMKKPRAYTMTFASVYPLYIGKAGKKGRSKAEVDNTSFI